MRITRTALFAAALAASFSTAGGQTIDLGKVRILDLTHAFDENTVYWPTSPSGFVLERLAFGPTPNGWFYAANAIRAPEHGGTHLDAPIHFSETGATVEQIPADTLVVPLAVINVTDKAAKDPDYQLSRSDLAAWERRHGRLPDRCCVAMNSGWARHVGDKAKYVGKDAGGVMHFPGIGPDAAAWLIKQRKVVGLAVDTLSLDHGASKDFKTHVTWLSSGRWGLENVANLDRVPAVGATLVVGLAKVKGATGGPARLFALI